jgi:hypothetical protein
VGDKQAPGLLQNFVARRGIRFLSVPVLRLGEVHVVRNLNSGSEKNFELYNGSKMKSGIAWGASPSTYRSSPTA